MTKSEYLLRKFREDVTDPGTGLGLEALKTGAGEIVAEYEDKEPFVSVKARMFAYICDNMAIGVSGLDYFPAFACWSREDRPLAGIISGRMYRVDAQKCPNAIKAASDWYCSHRGCLRHDFDHAAPDWDTAIRLGFPGLRDRLFAIKDRNVYHMAMITAIEAVIRAVTRLRDHAAGRNDEQFEALDALIKGPPETVYQVMMFQFLYFIFGEHVDMLQVRTLGGVDRLWAPFYRADIENGRITEEKFRDILRHFWWQWGSIDNWWGQPVFIGPDYNELSSIVLDVHDELDLPTPKMQLQMDSNTPDVIWLKALDMSRRHRSLVYCGVEPMRNALRTIGYHEEEIRDVDIWGCYEFQPRAMANATIPSIMSLVSPVTDILADAKDEKVDFAAFGDFKQAYFDEISRRSAICADVTFELEKVMDDFAPSLIHSLTIDDCVKIGANAIGSGMKYNTALMLQVGLGTAVDALMAVKEIVYERGEMSLKELGVLMAENWKGREDLRLRMFRSPRKWGAGCAEADELGRKIMHALAKPLKDRVNSRGGKFIPGGHSIDFFVSSLTNCGATPDGRHNGDEFSKNLSPAPGADRNGATAVIGSVGALETADTAGDIILDLMLLPSAVTGDGGLRAMRSLVEVYFAKGGCAVHFNVLDPAVYRDAQVHPEKYENLQVRVCGWNVRWNDLSRHAQDGYLLRADNLSAQ